MKTGRSPRHRPGIGYPRGDETRSRIVTAAIEVFGRRGYKQAATRDIAVAAGVKAAALHYYFSGKGGLYYACLERVTLNIVARFEPVLARLRQALDEGHSTNALIALHCELQECLIDSFYAPEEGVSVNLLLAGGHDADEIGAARELMRDRVNLPIYAVSSRVMGRIIGRSADEVATGLNAFAASGITMVFFLDQARISDAVGFSDPGPDAIVDLKALVRHHSTILLTGLAGQAERPPVNATTSEQVPSRPRQ